MTVQVVWTPAVGSAVTFETGMAAPFRMLTLDGTAPQAVPFTGSHVEGKTAARTVKTKKKVHGKTKIVTHKIPGQPGHTVLDTPVSQRLVVIQGVIQAADLTTLWAKRAALSAAMAVEPLALGSLFVSGDLRVNRGYGLPDVHLAAVPVSCAMPMIAGGSGLLPFDVEFHCPYPFWRNITATDTDIPTHNVAVNVTNAGDGASYPTFVIHGPAVDVTITNVTTGKRIKITGSILTGATVTVNHEKRTVVHSSGANWASHVARGFDGFWPLVPGVNSVKWDRLSTTGSPDVHCFAYDIYRGI